MFDPKVHFSRNELANNSVQVAFAFAKYALALKAHEDFKGDPTKSVATGQALYAAECELKSLALTNATLFPDQLKNIRADLDFALPSWAREVSREPRQPEP